VKHDVSGLQHAPRLARQQFRIARAGSYEISFSRHLRCIRPFVSQLFFATQEPVVLQLLIGRIWSFVGRSFSSDIRVDEHRALAPEWPGLKSPSILRRIVGPEGPTHKAVQDSASNSLETARAPQPASGLLFI
jgi:hypothetical protein